MRLHTFKIGGVHPKENKITAEIQTKDAALPKVAIFPLGQHIGAPANPVVIAHGLHPTQRFVTRFGQFLFSMDLPFSIIRTFKSFLFSINSYAQKIPPGPAPIIMTSY